MRAKRSFLKSGQKMSNKQFLALPVTGDTFAEVREKNCYYVDKTPSLKQVFYNNGVTVLILVRPNKFGKTMLLTMFEAFFKIDYKNPGDTTLQEKLFKGTKIFEDKEFCNEFMGQVPVINISFKDIKGKNFDEAYSKLAQTICAKVNEYSFLKDSSKLNENDKETFSKISDETYLKSRKSLNRSYLTSAIGSLISMLYAYFKRQVYVFIDDYDVPLVSALDHGYYDDMVKLYCHLCDFFKDFNKDPETQLPIVSNIVATSSSPIVQHSIPDIANNVKINTSLNKLYRYADIIGFTKDETHKLLKDYELENYSQTVEDYFGGYEFCYSDIFNPLDLIKFVEANCKRNLNSSNEKVKTDGYWVGETLEPVSAEYIAYLTDHDNQNMQDLIDGKSICFELNQFVGYCKLSEPDLDDKWTLLLNFGYLKIDFEKTKEEKKKHQLDNNVFARIPNLEIKNCFKDVIQKRFDSFLKKDNLADKIANALFTGDTKFVQAQLRTYLKKFVSIRDTATKAPYENYYHGFLNGVFTNCSKDFLSEYHSNYESGDGYADITFKSEFSEEAVIIEIKAAPVGSDLIPLSKNAIVQIESKNYAEPFLQNSMTQSIYAYGIAFAGKNCFISVKKIK